MLLLAFIKASDWALLEWPEDTSRSKTHLVDCSLQMKLSPFSYHNATSCLTKFCNINDPVKATWMIRSKKDSEPLPLHSTSSVLNRLPFNWLELETRQVTGAASSSFWRPPDAQHNTLGQQKPEALESFTIQRYNLVFRQHGNRSTLVHSVAPRTPTRWFLYSVM